MSIIVRCFLIALTVVLVQCKPHPKQIKHIISNSGTTVLKKEAKPIFQSISKASSLTVKNGLGKRARIDSKSIERILTQTYNIRGEKACNNVIAKLSSYNGNNLNNIKGFLAEEIHHNKLLEIKEISKVQSSVSGNVTTKMLEHQKVLHTGNVDVLKLDKFYEIDLLANHSKIGNFAIEVKNIDSPINDTRFTKLKTQLIKELSFCQTNGVNKLFWSNIGRAKLNIEQIEQLQNLGIVVLQHGSESPIINAKINMTKLKSNL